jgi:hypothetical protein
MINTGLQKHSQKYRKWALMGSYSHASFPSIPSIAPTTPSWLAQSQVLDSCLILIR